MASWKRHMSVAKIRNNKTTKSKGGSGGKSANYASYLPSVYTGISNRVDRYESYSQMDQDPEIGTGLDILADFCTQNDDDNSGPFELRYKDDNMGETEVTTLETALDSWTYKNDFKTRIWEIFRNTLKFGDQFFVRDPETFEWVWCDAANVEKVTVNESMGKEPIVYFMKDLSLNMQEKVMSNTHAGRDRIAYPGAMPNALGGGNGGQFQSAGGYSGSSSSSALPGDAGQNVLPVDARHVIHLSMSTGMDAFWPFGTSCLENIFKTYKQKELLEDSIIIYRVQRAPERRVFKIDVGDLPEHKAMQYVERMKNEIHQRRLPSNKGGSANLMDSAYNPLCLDMNTRIPLLDGRTLNIYELQDEYQQGIENWVYSCNPETGDIVPGNITWAGVTQKSAKVIKITLDTGETITCTPDHKIPVLGFGFKEAKDLTPEDSLISFTRTYEAISTNKNSGCTYEKVYNHETAKFEFTHRMVGTYFREIEKHQEFTYLVENVGAHKNTIHHADSNRYNNNPTNLQWMNVEDQFEYHSQQHSEHLASMSNEEYLRVTNKMSTTLTENFNTGSEEKKEEIRNNMRNYNHKIVSIEYVDDEIEVGTITIDGQERWHNFHTFATESGVFVKNSILEDFFFPQTADGRGSDVNVLPGGDNLGQIDDLRWFNNKLIRGLKIPSSYLPFGPEDGSHVSNDGGQGMLIQEHRFNKYCQRLQATLVRIFDDEFKKYLEHCGYNISPSAFEINFRPPTNFASYRKAELEGTMMQSYATLLDVPFIAKQTVLKKMGWSQDEIIANEKLWLQENPSKTPQGGGSASQSPGLSAVGVENPQDFTDDGFDVDVPVNNDGSDSGGSPISGAENQDSTF